LLAGDQVGILGVATDAGHVYWANVYWANGEGSIMRLDK
jgi:hypothetical protein